ncbi:hypothetical protein EYF80_022978 [Liparis tanakae]|uniref:Uncharacterized protein n=1 Tax=Liparis tanakae TaxID=230148 RepID=A0A4Z2HLN0_9TELE|nr:hypothetical protein EYF80_022978 [Liparis tanakae]
MVLRRSAVKLRPACLQDHLFFPLLEHILPLLGRLGEATSSDLHAVRLAEALLGCPAGPLLVTWCGARLRRGPLYGLREEHGQNICDGLPHPAWRINPTITTLLTFNPKLTDLRGERHLDATLQDVVSGDLYGAGQLQILHHQV